MMLEKILHPSDFTETSQVAFAHALRIALATHGDLRLLHVANPNGHPTYSEFPHVREVLVSWEVIPEGSSREAVSSLGINVSKLIVKDPSPVNAISTFLDEHPSSLVVLASHQRPQRWLGGSRAEAVSRASDATTLFVPDGVSGFVSLATGKIQLANVLIPVAKDPPPSVVFRSIDRLANIFGLESLIVHILHVGSHASLPAVPRSTKRMSFQVHLHEGDLVRTIVNATEKLDIDLLAMATDGHDGFLDALRGSTTEQVLRKIACPLLAVPPR